MRDNLITRWWSQSKEVSTYRDFTVIVESTGFLLGKLLQPNKQISKLYYWFCRSVGLCTTVHITIIKHYDWRHQKTDILCLKRERQENKHVRKGKTCMQLDKFQFLMHDGTATNNYWQSCHQTVFNVWAGNVLLLKQKTFMIANWKGNEIVEITRNIFTWNYCAHNFQNSSYFLTFRLNNKQKTKQY